MRLRRSELSTPASSERMIESAARSEADLVFLDLEDAVAPAEKETARARAAEALAELDWGARTRAVRITAVGPNSSVSRTETVLSDNANARVSVTGPKYSWP